MKRAISLALSMAMLLSLTSCGGGNSNGSSSAQSSASQSSTSSSGGGIEVDENLLTVDITFPASFFEGEDMSAFDPDAYAEEQGFNNAVLNEDGSVTVTMTKAKRNELMAEMDESAEEAYSEMVQSEETPYITEIKHSDSYDKVDIIVDRQGYENAGLASVFIPITVYFPAAFYQMFSGDNPRCEISFVDAETGETIESVVYPDALNSEG